MRKESKLSRIISVASLCLLTVLIGYICYISFRNMPLWLAIFSAVVESAFLVLFWIKALGYDRTIRKNIFLKTADIDNLELLDFADDELMDYIKDPQKMKSLKDKVASEKIQKEREDKINKLLK